MKALTKGLTALSPNCKEATHLQSEALDRKLSFAERIGLRIHLFLCKWCRRYAKQVKFLHLAAHQCGEHEGPGMSGCLSPEARKRIRKKLQSAQD